MAEIVGQPGWVSGNALALLIEHVSGLGSRGVETMRSNSEYAGLSGGSATVPALEVNYHPREAQPPLSPYLPPSPPSPPSPRSPLSAQPSSVRRFQQGVDNYAGCEDTWLDEELPDTSLGFESVVQWGATPDVSKVGLLKFGGLSESLNPSDLIVSAFVRSGPAAVALMRLVVHVQSPAAHATVVEAFNLLPEDDRTTLATEMARTGIDGQAYTTVRSPQVDSATGPAFLLYYAPAFLRQSVGNALVGLRVLAGVYRAARALFPPSEGIGGTVLVYIDQLKAGGDAESLCTCQQPSKIWILVRKSERECVVQHHTVFDETSMKVSPLPVEEHRVLKVDSSLLDTATEARAAMF